MRLDYEMAFKSDGTITGLRGTTYGVMGGALGTVGSGPAWASILTCMGPYKIPNINVTVKPVMTNRSPFGSFRAWGVQNGNIVHERLLEIASGKLGLDPHEVRRMNFPTPEEFPHFSGVAFTYDSGRYADALDSTLSAVDELGWRQRQADARADGRSLGIGYSFHIEPSAYGPSRILNLVGLQHSGFDEEVVRIDPMGKVTVYSGQINMGQGTHTIYAQIAADGLGVPIEDVKVVTGDTDSCPYTGYGTGGSRAAPLGGGAIIRATARLKEKVFRIAAELMEASPADLVIESGTISVKGSPARPSPCRRWAMLRTGASTGAFPWTRHRRSKKPMSTTPRTWRPRSLRRFARRSGPRDRRGETPRFRTDRRLRDGDQPAARRWTVGGRIHAGLRRGAVRRTRL